MKKLTGKQKAILNYLKKKSYTRMPPYRQIADDFGYNAFKAAYDHVHALVKKGYIKLDHGKIEFLDDKKN